MRGHWPVDRAQVLETCSCGPVTNPSSACFLICKMKKIVPVSWDAC